MHARTHRHIVPDTSGPPHCALRTDGDICNHCGFKETLYRFVRRRPQMCSRVTVFFRFALLHLAHLRSSSLRVASLRRIAFHNVARRSEHSPSVHHGRYANCGTPMSILTTPHLMWHNQPEPRFDCTFDDPTVTTTPAIKERYYAASAERIPGRMRTTGVHLTSSHSDESTGGDK